MVVKVMLVHRDSQVWREDQVEMENQEEMVMMDSRGCLELQD